MLLFCLCKDQNVVQVHYNNPFCYDSSEDVIYHGLEGSEAVGHSKTITRGSKRPRLVQKAVFHSSLGLMHILLKPQQTFSFVKYQAP